METVKAQIADFLNKCEELKRCKFIVATTKIKDLLKSIVNSAELYELFNTVATGFDYPAVKQRCFVEGNRCKVVLPDTVGERLAFIFCLLVEFDRNEINFNAFLQKYYPKDGSFYSSYHLFCDEVIGELENIVCDVFARELECDKRSSQLEQSTQQFALTEGSEGRETIILINAERDNVISSPMLDEDKEAAISILDSLELAVKNGDVALIRSLTYGYNYLVLATTFVSDTLERLMLALGNLVG